MATIAGPAGAAALPSSVTIQQWSLQGTDSWTSGNLGSGYAEGDVVPFRLDVTNAGNGTFDFSICRDFQSGTSFGYLFLDRYDTTVAPDLEGAVENNTLNGVTAAGDGATVTVVSVVDDLTPQQGDCTSAGERETEVQVTVSGLADGDSAYVLWGGHLASPLDPGVGPGNGASTLPGSSLHMKLLMPSKDLPANPNQIAPIQTGTLEVTKAISGDPGDDTFDLQVDGVTEAAGVVDGGTTGPLDVDPGTFTVSEVAGADTDLDDYTTTIDCVDQDGAVASGDGISLAGVVVEDGDAVVCTITNTRETGSLTVVKVLDPADDPGLFNLLIDGNVEATDVGDGGTTGAQILNTGTHTVAETAGTDTDLDDYTTTLECLDNEADAVPSIGGEIEIGDGDTIVCTFTNTREAAYGQDPGDPGDDEDPYGEDPDDPGYGEDPYGEDPDGNEDPDPFDNDPDPGVEPAGNNPDPGVEPAGNNPDPQVAGETETPDPADPAVNPAGEVSPDLDVAPAAELPRTGPNGVMKQSLLALALMVAGLGAMVAGRRRRCIQA